MRKCIVALVLMVLLLFTAGCNLKQSPTKLVELEKYSAMTIDGTTSIEVIYVYTEGGITTYNFVIDDREIIAKLMTELFNMELKDYPRNQIIDFYLRQITVNQGDNEYTVSLTHTSGENGDMYICISKKICELIDKYIEDNYK